MKVISINTQTTKARICKDADVKLSNDDAKFLFHALRTIDRMWQQYWDTVSRDANTKGSNADRAEQLDKVNILTAKVSGMILPIVEQILIPVEDVDTFLQEYDINHKDDEDRGYTTQEATIEEY